MTNRILAGKHPDTGEIGLWISKATKNARTSTNTDDFLFDPSKYLSRPYVRFTVGAFSRGAFRSTVTFSDGTKGDRYDWNADFVHGLLYVPLYVVQLGKDVGEPWADAAKIALPLPDPGGQGIAMFTYAASDPSKTPIIVTSGYNVTTQTYTPPGVTRTSVAIYRVPLF